MLIFILNKSLHYRGLDFLEELDIIDCIDKYFLIENVLLLITHMETVYTFCIQKLHKRYTTDVYNMYTKCIQNVYCIFINFCAATFCIQNKKNCQLNFVHKMYAKVCWNVVYILYTKVCQNVGYIFRLWHMRNKGVWQSHSLSLNSQAIDVWKVACHPPSRRVVACNNYFF